eukprot:NODE_3717_length_1996_cov_9.257357.p1 GENE.NODE_3717_length_1996_cov_9.257357~~NODE_3717_length_1996_cov_9.257357.p1  ORF type:complete len:631 (-),score=203.12 NODE_3717_length_1996_cov_9.257357:104-1867(-)
MEGRVEEAMAAAVHEKQRFNEQGYRRGVAVMLFTMAETDVSVEGRKDRTQCMEWLKEAREIYIELEDKQGEAGTSLTLANTHIRNLDLRGWDPDCKDEDGHGCEEAAMQAEAAYAASGDQLGRGKALYCVAIARVLGLVGKDFVSPAEEAAKIFRENDFPSFEGVIHAMLARWHMHLKQPAEAIAPANEAVQIYSNLDEDETDWLTTSLKVLFEAHLVRGELEEGEEILSFWLKTFQQRGNKQAMAVIHECYLDYYGELGQWQEAVDSGHRALALVRAISERKWEASLLATLATALLNTGGLQKALRYVQLSIHHFQQLEEEASEMQATEILAEVCGALGKFKQSTAVANQARLYYQRVQEPGHEGNVVRVLIRTHMWAGEADEAIDAGHEAIDLYRSIDDHASEISTMFELHRVHLKMNNMAAACAILEKGLEVAKFNQLDMHAEWMTQAILKLAEVQLDVKSERDVSAPVHVVGAGHAVEERLSENPGLDTDTVMTIVTHIAREVTSSEEDLEIDSPLMEAGMDSLSAVAFRNQLMHSFEGIALPASLVFDAPTVRLVVLEIVERSKDLPTLPKISMTAVRELKM